MPHATDTFCSQSAIAWAISGSSLALAALEPKARPATKTKLSKRELAPSILPDCTKLKNVRKM
ncbi:LSU ribosomal protein L17p [Qipengyuania citrea LAMA 915]|uniref:LSU ribosomal protein L17p n=1 Tax=Qipengyuania citrea LAMA 915 TaxID=1306953 RepID=A0A0L1KB96_9SPHN|nr:LSU ribosomal protein L17p [Qipengyuania citrea LAMA 915]